MPLHVIPLCDFKYVRDIYSGATFMYDTTGEIQNYDGPKAVCIQRVIEIDKISKKLMYKEASQIEKVTPNRYMRGEMNQIDKSIIKRSLVAQTKEINIEYDRDYEKEVPDIDKMISRELEPPQRELNKSESQELEPIIREIDLATSKMFEGATPLLIEYSQDKYLKISEVTGLNKGTSLHLNIDPPENGNMNKIQDKNLGADTIINLNKSDTLIMSNDSIIELPNYKHDSLIEFVGDREIQYSEVEAHIMDRICESEIIKDHSIMGIDRLDIKEMSKEDEPILVDDLTLVDIGYDESKRLIYRDVIPQIDQYNGAVDLYRIAERDINKDKSKRLFYPPKIKFINVVNPNHYLQPITIIPVFKSNENYLDRLKNTDLFKLSENYLDRLHITDVFKIQDKNVDRIYTKEAFKIDSMGLSYSSLTPLYKEHQKPILDLTIEDIYKDHSRSLNGALLKGIELPRENKFIEVTKRWWWLNDTSPKDLLILPNKDYGGMIDLLNNNHYEYLRYTNHPIEWGKTWGQDSKIPPDAISIEIMLDLVNIITMTWHKNVQGWLSVSGKEGIQLLMELLYDWYNMNASDPNHSYYRAYKWVRWEAEKVYFLDTTSGLQSIGILVRNLRDYLKFHHFNRVPIWRNPKAMDKERNFNRLAQNGDLMVDINKNKGKRHYFIETQNFEKKSRLIQE